LDISTPAGRLVSALKQQLRLKSLHYRDVASRLKISERTVKRYFSGKGLTLEVLQQLADVVELDMLSLVILAQEQNVELPEMTRQQQAALRRSGLALAIYYFLNFGMTPAQIAREFDLQGQIDAVLQKLESFGLIHRFSPNGVKLLAGRSFGDRSPDHLTEHKIASTRRFLTEMDLANPNCQWLYQAVRLTHASALRLEQIMKRFVLDAAAMTRSEIDLPPDETQWYRLFVGAEPLTRKKLLRGT